MQDISKLCMVCLSIKDDNDICPRCRKNVNIIQETPLLPLKSIIAERYCIAKAVKRNGEGVTYSAYDLKLDKPVSVREFFPEAIASRGLDELTVVPSAGSEPEFSRCRADFIELWTKLMRLRGLSALVTVTDVFQAGSTAYAVYDESEMLTLSAYLRTTGTGYISWEKARVLFMPVLSTIGTLHTTGVLHRGINPSSFIFSKDGKLKLTDFSIAAARTAYSDLQPELFDGYAPVEQYSSDNMMGSWSDIYSFCAVLYRSLIGARPIDAKTREKDDKMMIPAKFADLLPSYVISALINGMQVAAQDRTQTVEQLRNTLSASPRGNMASAPLFTKPSPAKYIPAKDAEDDGFENVGDGSAAPEDRNDGSIESAAPEDKPVQPAAEEKSPAESGSAIVTQDDRGLLEEMRLRREEDEALLKKMKRKKGLIAVLCILLAVLLAGAAFLGAELWKLTGELRSSEPVSADSDVFPVPNFIGLDIDSVLSDSKYTDILEIQQEDAGSASAEKGVIMKQSIDAGTLKENGSVIVLTVSAGPQDKKVPEIVGLAYAKAAKKLKEEGLKCTKSGVVNDGEHAADTVKEVIPDEGKTVREGSAVTVVVWLPEETESETNAVIDLNDAEQYTAAEDEETEAEATSEETASEANGETVSE